MCTPYPAPQDRRMTTPRNHSGPASESPAALSFQWSPADTIEREGSRWPGLTGFGGCAAQPTTQRRGWAPGGLGPPGLHLLTTTGRRSGQPRTTPVRTVTVDGRRYLVAAYGPVGWVHNIREQPSVELRRGHTRNTLQARVVDPDESGAVLRRYLDEVKITAP